jgi:hypothetical protein
MLFGHAALLVWPFLFNPNLGMFIKINKITKEMIFEVDTIFEWDELKIK